MRSYFVYIVRCSDGSLYTGSTTEINRRVLEHNSGRGARYTRARLPVVLSYVEKCPGKGRALRREYEIKRLSRSGKLLLCATYLAKRQSVR